VGYLQTNTHDQRADLRALLAEQKKTNRFLSAIVYSGVGFVLGMVVIQIVIRVRLF
jgi:ubiquinone biosynthesis protein